jgi:uncharacterized membrane protein YqjE
MSENAGVGGYGPPRGAHAEPATGDGVTETAGDGADVEGRSLGEIVSQLSNDLSRLMRQELQLAKVEMQQEAKKAGLAAGLVGGAGLAGWMAVLFASVTVMWALSKAMDIVWAALIVTVLWVIAGAVMFAVGRKKMAAVSPKPDQTIETLQEDKQWLKAQKS